MSIVMRPLISLLAATVAITPLVAAPNSVRPGDDFEAYANGQWRAAAMIPPDRTNVGTFYEVTLKAEAATAAIVRQAVASRSRPGSDARRIADAYAAFMDRAGIERRGLAPLQPELARITALRDRKALAAMLGGNIRADLDPINTSRLSTENLFGLLITQAFDNPTRTVPYLLQGGLGLPNRDYYLATTPEMIATRTAYQAYVTRLLSLAGFADTAARAARIVALETRIAAAQASIPDTQDLRKADNPWTKAEFATRAPGLDWKAFFAAAGLGEQRDFIVWQPGAARGIAALVASEPLESWRDWLAFHRINRASAMLPKAFDDAHFDFYGRTLNGLAAQRPRDKRAIDAVNIQLGDAVGRLYVARFFPPSSKADVEAMAKNILIAFDKRVATLAWMAPATKAEARRKIATMRIGIGYPARWRDYAGLEIRADDPIGNADRAERTEYRRQLAKIGRPVDRGEWWDNAQKVNAYNLPLQNAVMFPAAILSPPFYDPKRDTAYNYGSAGAVIGHEISHSFDSTGAAVDATGKLANWWTPEDLKHFEQAGAAFVRQYDAYEALPGLHLKGQQELGENIADAAGLIAAYEAYHASLGGKPAPVIDGLTGDQRFFLGFAHLWRQKIRDEAQRNLVTTDVHAPMRFRPLTVRNIDPWYPAFDVKAGDALYLPPERRIRIW